MKDSTHSHSIPFSHNGHHEYPYPYNAWVTQIFDLADFARAFTEQMQLQQVRLTKELWQQEKEVQLGLLTELVRTHEFPGHIAAKLWLPYGDQPPQPKYRQLNNAQQNRVQSPKQAATQNQQAKSGQVRRQAHDLQQKTKPIIDASFSATRSPQDTMTSSNSQPPKKRRVLYLTIAGICLINIGIGVALYSNENSRIISLPSLAAITESQAIQKPKAFVLQESREPNTQLNSNQREQQYQAPSSPRQDVVTLEDQGRITQRMQDIELTSQELTAQEITAPGQPDVLATAPKITATIQRILMELMRQASELNIEPESDRDTALHHLRALEAKNADHESLSRAHFSLQSGYEALGTLATARQRNEDAQRYRILAQTHAIRAQEFRAVGAE